MTQSEARRRLFPVAIVLIVLVGLCIVALAALRGNGQDRKEIGDMDEGQPVRLEAGLPVERRIVEGATHEYLLHLEAGQYARVAAEQKGGDVVLRLLAPGGAAQIEVDSPTGERGVERVSVVADSAREHRFAVSLSEGAEPGSYEIRLEDLRPATDRDRRLVAAEKVFADGDVLRRAKSLDQALARYRQALEMWEADGERGGQARALYRIGMVLEKLGQRKEAEDAYRRAVDASREAGDRALEAVVLNRRGTLLRLSGRYEESRVCHEQAVEAFRALDNRNGEKDALNNLGVVQWWAGRIQAAIDAYEGALALARELDDRTVQVTVLVNLGEVYLDQGKYPEARDAFEAALAIARELGDDVKASNALTFLGETEAREGRLRQARDAFEQGLDLQRRLGEQRGKAITLNFLGTVLLKSGDPERARARYDEALKIFRDLGDVRGEAIVLVNLGRLEESLRDFETAAESYGRSLELFERLQDRAGLAMARFGSARALVRQEDARPADFQAARALLEDSLETVESLRVETQSLSMRTSYLASKQHYWDLYVDVLMGLHERDPSGGFAALALQAAERRRFRSLLDALAETRTDIRRGIEPALLEEERSLQQRLDRVERQRLQALESGADGEQIETLERESRDLLRQVDLVRARIREQSPRFTNLVQPETVSLEQIQQSGLLADDDLLLVYSLGEERSFVWAVSRGSFTVRVLDGRERIEVSAERFLELLTRPSRRAKALRDDAAADLATLVLTPVADRTADFTRLLIVADGALQKIPFAALPLPGTEEGRLVVERHEIVLLPSASVLATLRREAAAKPLRVDDPWVAVLADPVFRADDPRVGGKGEEASSAALRDSGLRASIRDLGLSGLERLPHTDREAKAIERWAQEKDRFVARGFEADRRLVTSGRLRDYRVLHFATHSIINDRQPELSGLVLSLVGPDGRPQDGFLRLHEIYNLDLKADLVVLSACRTGVGREIRGEGLAGIVRGFMYAGVPGVIVSLWNVDDAATAELMSRFYEYLLEEGQLPANALGRAQRDLLKSSEWSAPEYWAGFVFLGDPAIKLGGGIEKEDTGDAQPAQRAGSDLPPPKIAPDDEDPPVLPRDRQPEV